MANEQFDVSEAIVVYLGKYPGKNTEEFDARYGSNTDQAKASIREILSEAMRLQPDWSTLDLNGAGDYVETVIHDLHPYLSQRALTAIGNYYTYMMR